MSRQLCPHHPDVDYQHAWGCPDCLRELRAKLAALELKAADRDDWQDVAIIAAKKRDEALVKLAASERANAEMRALLEDYHCSGIEKENLDERADKALSSDAGRDYVLRSQVDAVWYNAMTEAAHIASCSAENAVIVGRICAARDARKESAG